ncbi:MAG: acyl-CoA desaturase, partial [Xanthobacteraceae bacterium]|nr:acyl-CoA desaturase [Xanthobacteraceae bacterium]
MAERNPGNKGSAGEPPGAAALPGSWDELLARPPLVRFEAVIGMYFVRMFAITGFLHRYFAHKTYSTSRAFQFVMAVWAALAVQRGALWWACTHRHHHKHSDEEDDKHSPVVDGFWWSHIGWITAKRNFPTDYSKIADLAKYPEL